MYQIDQERIQRQYCWDNGPDTNTNCNEGGGTCVYVYTSQPQPLPPPHGRPKFRNNVPYPRGVGDYYNLMWDGRIFRGKPSKKRPEKNFIECFNVRKPKTITKARQPKVVYEGQSSTPPPPEKWTRYDGKVESNMEELDPHLIEDENAVVQLETTRELPQCPSLKTPPPGIDVASLSKATEILPGDLSDFDNKVISIVEALVGQVVERAIHELLEEEELESLRVQQSNFEALRLKEQLKLIQLKEQQDRRNAEKVRVETEADEYLRFHEDVTNRLDAVAFTSLYLGDPLSDVLDGLRNQNNDAEIALIISNDFNPWLNQLTQNEVRSQLLCRNLLDDIILSTVKRREADFFMGEQEALRQQSLGVEKILGMSMPQGEEAGEEEDWAE